jgi:hypothetical protein
LYAANPVTTSADFPMITRVTLLRQQGKVLAINRSSPPDGSAFRLTEPVVESLRFR